MIQCAPAAVLPLGHLLQHPLEGLQAIQLGPTLEKVPCFRAAAVGVFQTGEVVEIKQDL